MTHGDLRVADGVEVAVLVDNVSDLLSTVPHGVTTEIPNVLKAGAREISGQCLCCAQWGLALVITVTTGEVRRSLLFDGGPEAYGIERNGDRLGLDFGRIEDVVLSHGHWDHAGGVPAAVRMAYEARRRPVPVHVNPGMFVSRGMRMPSGQVIRFKDIPSTGELEAAGGVVTSDEGPRLLLDRLAYLSGEIPRVTSYEKGLPGHVQRGDDDEEWEEDPWILDERFLAIRLRGKGVVVFTACSHAGVVNVLDHARALFAPEPLYAVVGGFHLSGAACEKIIPETIADLQGFNLARIVPGHCTGWRAVLALVDAFGEEVVVPSAVGRLHRL